MAKIQLAPASYDLSACYKFGEKKEIEFVRKLRARGVDAIINPEKGESKYAIDLIINGHHVDLKWKGLPFYLSKKLVKRDPNEIAVINDRDMKYENDYPGGFLMFWFQQEAGEKYQVKVGRRFEVLIASFVDIRKQMDDGCPKRWNKHKIRQTSEGEIIIPEYKYYLDTKLMRKFKYADDPICI